MKEKGRMLGFGPWTARGPYVMSVPSSATSGLRWGRGERRETDRQTKVSGIEWERLTEAGIGD